ncbi:MAG: hypothetical protein IT580_08975 [Verrucomicrobiales bacterium]|nr:hypothetical protein [Verrucomicrobiales bacterium]
MSRPLYDASPESVGGPLPCPPLPAAIASFGAVTHHGSVYVCGGYRGVRHAYSADMVSGALHRLPVAGGTAWEELPSVDPAQGAPLVAAGDALYRVGGMAARNPPGQPSDLHSKAGVHRFDLLQRAWTEIRPLPAARSSHDACVVGDDLYVAGGWRLSGNASKGEWHDRLLRLRWGEPHAAWEPIAQPFRRRALAVASWGDEVWCLGGIDDEGDPSGAVDIFQTRTGKWSKGPELPDWPMRGFGCSAIAHEGQLFVSGMKGDLCVPSSDRGSWHVVATLRHARFFHQLVPAGPGELWAIAGEDSDGKRADVEVVRVG